MRKLERKKEIDTIHKKVNFMKTFGHRKLPHFVTLIYTTSDQC